ncbi:MAG: DUF3137 domain-containing protein [Pseudomonadota bacterium]
MIVAIFGMQSVPTEHHDSRNFIILFFIILIPSLPWAITIAFKPYKIPKNANYYVAIGYCILMIIFGLLSFKSNYSVIIGLASIYVMIFLMFKIAFLSNNMRLTYRLNFKHLIIRPIVSFIDENLSYAPEEKVPLKVFIRSRLFDRPDNRLWVGEDYVEGTIGKIAMRFSKVNALKQIGATPLLIFRGLFFEFNLNFNFERVTFIVPAEERRRATNIIRLRIPDSPEFARSFAIYSNNPAIAHQLLTTDFKHRLLTFRRRIEKPVYLSLIGDKLYLAIAVNKDLFDPPMAQSVLNFELIKASFEYMRLSTEIVEMLKDAIAQLNKPSLPNSVPPNAKLTPYEQFRRFYEINLFSKLLRFKRQNYLGVRMGFYKLSYKNILIKIFMILYIILLVIDTFLINN